ncbi:MAG: hypothetical protein JRJ69_13255 [Deltaproteobacteria bacterium]|nr:hypothetical protein [Deltaproteobacteria bacterium]
MAAAEKTGVPAIGIFCRGFTESGVQACLGEGLTAPRMVEFPPPNIQTQTFDEIYENAKFILDKVIQGLIEEPVVASEVPPQSEDASPRTIIFKGNLYEVNEFLYRQRFTDGLAVIPPTLEAVERMLKYTDRSPDEVVGVLRPARREATIWNIAVNGVMAGCPPEFMPLLIAVIEAVADPRFGLEHAGATQSSTPAIFLNGPIRKELDFNSGQGAMRPERRGNMAVSRFLRLVMVNVCRYLVGSTDMGSFGRNYVPVLPENEEESPWQPLSVDRGFEPGNNVVTVMLMHCMSDHWETAGSAEVMLNSLAIEVARELKSTVTPLVRFGPEMSPVIGLSAEIAHILSKAGYTKSDIKNYLFEKARVPAYIFDEDLEKDQRGLTACSAVKSGLISKIFCESEDPQRLLPVVHNPGEFQIIVGGSMARCRGFVMGQAGAEGLATSKKIELPANWDNLPKSRKPIGIT